MFSPQEKGLGAFERGLSRARFLLAMAGGPPSGRVAGAPVPTTVPAPSATPGPGVPPPLELTAEEIADNERAMELGVNQVSWEWPLSFFKAIDAGQPIGAHEAGEPLHFAYIYVGTAGTGGLLADWYSEEHFLILPIDGWPPDWPQDLRLETGDVAMFLGALSLTGGAGHSLIATGHDDEVSHMWWNRQGQLETWQTGKLSQMLADKQASAQPPWLPDPGSGDPGSGYMVTRDRLSVHAERWNRPIEGARTDRPAWLFKLRPKYRRFADFRYFWPLPDVFFETDSADLDDAAAATLDENAQWLLANPEVRIVLEGHCDDTGAPDHNMELGMRRATAVRDDLVFMGGIDATRIQVVSYGESRPFVPVAGLPPDQVQVAREFNRRVHFVIIP